MSDLLEIVSEIIKDLNWEELIYTIAIIQLRELRIC